MSKMITFSNTDEAIDQMTGPFKIAKALLLRIEIESNHVRNKSCCKKEDLRVYCSHDAVSELQKADFLWDDMVDKDESVGRIFGRMKVYEIYTLDTKGDIQFSVESN